MEQSSNRIPYNNLAAGIEHGPYPAAPHELIDHYLYLRHRIWQHDNRSDEQLIADTESEWQADMHSGAVDEAVLEHRISADHAAFMLTHVLRPWFIGSRTPHE